MADMEQLFMEGEKLISSRHPEVDRDRFTRAGEKVDTPATVYLNRGAAYFIIGELDWAIKDFSRVLAVDSDNERAFYYRGLALLNRGEYIDAIEDLTRAITLNHSKGAAFLARAMAYAEVDCITDSVMDLKTAVAFADDQVKNFYLLLPGRRKLFAKAKFLLRDDGPWFPVLDSDEVARLKKWLHIPEEE